METAGFGFDIDRTPGMLAFMKEVRGPENTAYLQDLYKEWNSLLDSMHIAILIRQQLDKWFQTCYRSRQDLEELEEEASKAMATNKRDKLYDEFIDLLDRKIESIPSTEQLVVLQWIDAKDRIMNMYNESSEWITTAIDCVEHEHRMINRYTEARKEDQTDSSRQRLEKEIKNLKDSKREFQTLLEKLSSEMSEYKSLCGRREKDGTDYEKLCYLQENKRPRKKNMERLEESMRSLDEQLIKVRVSRESLAEKVVTMFNQILEKTKVLTIELQTTVASWRHKFSLHYADLALKPDLDRLAQCCADTGKIMFDLYKMSSQHEAAEADDTSFQSNIELLVDMLHRFLKGTFVVTEQEDYVIKVDKKYLFKVVVRILGASDLPCLAGSEVKAFLAYEQDLNKCYCDNDLDIAKVENDLSNLLTSNTTKFKNNKSKVIEGCFHHVLTFNKDFARPSTGKKVHEELYRLLFTATLKFDDFNWDLWTVSPPVVITTGANQACSSLASIMWECYNTDVFELPFPNEIHMTWEEVFAMLDLKIRKICATRGLTDVNKRHLKRRLLGDPDLPDDTPVNLDQFCFDKLKKVGEDNDGDVNTLDFSFWKWFISIYNLICTHLELYWKDGLIHGFLSRDDGVDLLKTARPMDGMFILRFSDNEIVHSQGIKSMFGKLAACVMITRADPSGHIKRQIASKLNVGSHAQFKDKNLAMILKGTQDKKGSSIYKCLHPGQVKRENTFDTKIEQETINRRYLDPKELWVVDMEQSLDAVEREIGKRRPSSMDSGFDAASPRSCTTPGNGNNGQNSAKRSRNASAASDRHPSLMKQLGSPAPSHPSPTHQSPAHPYSPGGVSDISSCMGSMTSGVNPGPSSISGAGVGPSQPTQTQSQIPNLPAFGAQDEPGVSGCDIMDGQQSAELRTYMSSPHLQASSMHVNNAVVNPPQLQQVTLNNNNSPAMYGMQQMMSTTAPNHNHGPQQMVVMSTAAASNPHNPVSALQARDHTLVGTYNILDPMCEPMTVEIDGQVDHMEGEMVLTAGQIPASGDHQGMAAMHQGFYQNTENNPSSDNQAYQDLVNSLQQANMAGADFPVTVSQQVQGDFVGRQDGHFTVPQAVTTLSSASGHSGQTMNSGGNAFSMNSGSGGPMLNSGSSGPMMNSGMNSGGSFTTLSETEIDKGNEMDSGTINTEVFDKF